jgi:hypothetical protein
MTGAWKRGWLDEGEERGGLAEGLAEGLAWGLPEGLAERLPEGLAQLVYRSHVPDPRWEMEKWKSEK